ncbi:MAG: transglycosylase domain-containing protein [Ruminococcus sp.]|nr:transglycosylase domain-containing protein [Ruminococcus sp.]
MKRLIRKAAKLLLALLTVSVLAAACILGACAYRGYKMHTEALRETPLEIKALAVRTSADFCSYSELPEFYINAVISVEDKRFYKHSGVDPIAVVRAVAHDIAAGSPEQGGSTITQQLAKNLYYSREKKLERKFAELFTAFEIEKSFSKEEIFELYVNVIYFGSGYYGISSAARGYCGKSPAELTEYECAMLAGLPNAPSAYSPDTAPELTEQRTEQVLKEIKDNK